MDDEPLASVLTVTTPPRCISHGLGQSSQRWHHILYSTTHRDGSMCGLRSSDGSQSCLRTSGPQAESTLAPRVHRCLSPWPQTAHHLTQLPWVYWAMSQACSSPGPLHKHVLREHVWSLFLPGLYHLEFGKNHRLRAGTHKERNPQTGKCKSSHPSQCFLLPHTPWQSTLQPGFRGRNSDRQ